MKASQKVARDARQLFRWCLVNGKLQELRVAEVTSLILRSKRRGYLHLLRYFYRLLRLELARHTAEVESALPLPFDLGTKVQTSLAGVYGRDLIVRFAHRPALIAGMRITVGNNVYDGSVQSRLRALEKCF